MLTSAIDQDSMQEHSQFLCITYDYTESNDDQACLQIILIECF